MRVRLSWGSCSRGHNYVGCPFSVTHFLAVAREGRGSPDPRRCRPQGSCPSRRFRLARGSLEVFWTPPIAVAPDASRPYSMPLASLELPLQSFPFPGSRARSRGPSASVWVRSPIAAGAAPAEASRPLSRIAPALCRSRPPEGGPGTHEPGRTLLAVASPVASARPKAHRTCRPLPTDAGLTG